MGATGIFKAVVSQQKLFRFWQCKYYFICKPKYGAELVKTSRAQEKKLNSRKLLFILECFTLM